MSLERVDDRTLILETDEPWPESVQPGIIVDNATANPDVVIRGCTMRGNRARGFLLHSRGRTLVEDCYFHNTGPAIIIGGADVGDKWYESGHPKNVTLRNNVFNDCNCLNGRGAAIVVDGTPLRRSADDPERGGRLTVVDNVFRTFGPGLLFARNLDGVRFEDNEVMLTDDYPYEGEPAAPVRVENVRDARVEEA